MQVTDLNNLSLPLGERVQIHTKEGVFTGTVVAANNRQFFVQGEKYRQSYLKTDLVTGQIKLKLLKKKLNN